MHQHDEINRLTRLLDENYARAAAELNGFDPGVVVYAESGWRVQDIISHLLAWDSEVTSSLTAYHAGSAYRIPDFDLQRYNAASYEKRKGHPASHIYTEWENARSQLKSIVAQMTPAELDGEMTYPSGRRGKANALIEEVMEHQHEHFADIYTALKGKTTS
jgi:hypothetical protein